MELSRDSILKAVSGQPDRFDNKGLARHLGVKGDDRRVLRQLLRDLVDEGRLLKSKRKPFAKLMTYLASWLSASLVLIHMAI